MMIPVLPRDLLRSDEEEIQLVLIWLLIEQIKPWMDCRLHFSFHRVTLSVSVLISRETMRFI